MTKKKDNHKKKMGRPKLYTFIAEWLLPDELYSAGMIAKLYAKHMPDVSKKQRLRVRINMGRLKSNYKFPREGDGMVAMPKESSTPAWRGSRWIQALKP